MLLRFVITTLVALLINACSAGLDSDRTSEDIPDYLSINNAYAAFDHNDNFILYPLNDSYFRAADFTARFSFPLIFDLYLEDSLIKNGGSFTFRNLAINDSFKLDLKSADKTLSYKLIFSALPLIQITSSNPLKDTQLPASLMITSYNAEENLKNTLIGLEYRGRFTLGKPKKSFRFETRDKDDFTDKDDERLLGLRSDDDWILDGSSDDPLILRNRIALDLFEKLWQIPHDPQGQSVNHGRFVELFFNNRYHGIYNLAERIDRKLLQLDEPNSLLFKAKRGDNVSYIYNDVHTLYEIQYPDENDLHFHNQAWERLKDLSDFVAYSNNDVFINDIAGHLNMENILNYHIFMLVISATDNHLHNFFLAQNDNDPFFFLPWDLNDSFECIGCFNGNFVIDRLITFDMYKMLLKNRWQNIKHEQADPDNIFNMFRQYFELLSQSKAYHRNAIRWSTGDSFISDFARLQDWIQNRYNRVNTYIEGL